MSTLTLVAVGVGVEVGVGVGCMAGRRKRSSLPTLRQPMWMLLWQSYCHDIRKQPRRTFFLGHTHLKEGEEAGSGGQASMMCDRVAAGTDVLPAPDSDAPVGTENG